MFKMNQRIITMNLDLYDNEDTYNKFKRNKEKLIQELSYIATNLEKNIEGNLRDLNSRRERLLETVIDMNIKLQKWVDFNIPKRETGRKILSDLN